MSCLLSSSSGVATACRSASRQRPQQQHRILPTPRTRSCASRASPSRLQPLGRSVAARVAADDAAAAVAEVLVDEVMNPKPVLLQESMSLKDAVHKMLDANVAGAPVVNEAGQLVGVLSESDIIYKGAGQPDDHFLIPPIFIGALDSYFFLRDNKKYEEELKKIVARTVRDAMVAKGKVVSVTPATPMATAAHQMLHHDVNLLPVVEKDQVVGVITRHDVLRGIYASKSPLL